MAVKKQGYLTNKKWKHVSRNFLIKGKKELGAQSVYISRGLQFDTCSTLKNRNTVLKYYFWDDAPESTYLP